MTPVQRFHWGFVVYWPQGSLVSGFRVLGFHGVLGFGELSVAFGILRFHGVLGLG